MSAARFSGRWFHGGPACVVVLGLLLSIFSPAAAAPVFPAELAAKIDPFLLRELLQVDASDKVPIVVTFRQQTDLASLPPAQDRQAQTNRVVEALQATARTAQAAYIPALLALQQQKHVQSFQSFWVINGAAVVADRTAILELAARPDVSLISADRWQQWIDPSAETSVGRQPTGVDWGIERIRADQVWSALGIDGAGVVVATMDSGVDWLHPILHDAYRGIKSAGAVHEGHWQDLTDAASPVPVDGVGHGTHVTGLIVGQDGIGVAPGAEWIAARIFDDQGYAKDSWVHAGFEWILAPAGYPSLAPDIVNNSWSVPDASSQTFRADVQAWQAAGILSIFSAGNNGPHEQSIGAPASYPETLAVAATDADDDVATFSSRGPSPFAAVKPDVAAPGVQILSSLPDEQYGSMSGTSMAAPLVAGLAALVHQADPTLDWPQVTRIITSTAVPVGGAIPNQAAGWGRIDALAAVASATDPGYLAGLVRGRNAAPLAAAAISAWRDDGALAAHTRSDKEGAWDLALSPGSYDLSARYFGYEPITVTNLAVVTGTITYQDLDLTALPAGTVQGTVVESGSLQPLPAVLRVLDTPVQTTAAAAGSYTLNLPAGVYDLAAEAWGYHVGRAVVVVAAGETTAIDFELDASPTVLLVDSGAWYYGSEIDYFQTALDDQDTLFDLWTIKSPLDQTPEVTDLLPYDVVVWSSPFDSPGYIGAGNVISDYLRAGGDLILSGQDVGFWDGGMSGFLYASYYRDMLKARVVADSAADLALSGTELGPLEGFAFGLNGPDSAANQLYPDGVAVTEEYIAEPLLRYASGELGGIGASTCLPYRSFYLSFGLEGAGDRSTRAELTGRALAWLSEPRATAGLVLDAAQGLQIGLPGVVVTHTVELFNTGEVGWGDVYEASVSGALWPVTVVSPTVPLQPCSSATVPIRVHIPAGLGWDEADQLTLTVRSAVSPTLVMTMPLTTKTPAPLLVVDDDRWYDQDAVYQAALDASGVAYDYYDAESSPTGRRTSPSTDRLSMYPMVVWFTGYDWYSPLDDAETATLESYLAGGGRLWLSSQDALYYQADSELAQSYFGVQSYREDMMPSVAYGGDGALGIQGAFELAYPFRNFSDGVIPAGSATAEWYADGNQATGLSNTGDDWKTLFMAFPFEALPVADQPDLMSRMLGWLSWLGSSEWSASAVHVTAGEVVTLTARVTNDGPTPVTTTFSNTLPAGLVLQPASLSGATLASTVLQWQGELTPGATHEVRYAAVVSQSVTNTATLAYAEHNLSFGRPLTVWVDRPDLTASVLEAQPPSLRPGQTVTWSLVLRNDGAPMAQPISSTWWLPETMEVLTDTLAATAGTAMLEPGIVRWSGPVAEPVTVTLGTVGQDGAHPRWYGSAALIDDGETRPIVRAFWLGQQPLRFYLPLILRNG